MHGKVVDAERVGACVARRPVMLLVLGCFEGCEECPIARARDADRVVERGGEKLAVRGKAKGGHGGCVVG